MDNSRIAPTCRCPAVPSRAGDAVTTLFNRAANSSLMGSPSLAMPLPSAGTGHPYPGFTACSGVLRSVAPPTPNASEMRSLARLAPAA